MDEYIKRETFLKDIEERYCLPCEGAGKDFNGCKRRACWVSAMRGDVIDAPAADVAPVVHCKDCKHSTLPSELTQRYGKLGTLTCHNMYAPSNRRNVGSNDFCSYGEREEND